MIRRPEGASALKFGTSVVAFALLAGTAPQPVWAQNSDLSDVWYEDCVESWNEEVQISTYCPNGTMDRDGVREDECKFDAACSITASVNTNPPETHTWTISVVSFGFNPGDVDDLDICFTPSDTSTTGYVADVKNACDDGDTSSSVATGIGLPDPDANLSSSQ